MTDPTSPFDLLEYPVDYEFKAFGPNDDVFSRAVMEAVKEVVPLSRHALRERPSSGSRYRCVTLLVRVQSRQQIEQIYLHLQRVEGLRYLL